jgi:hypothetical protein
MRKDGEREPKNASLQSALLLTLRLEPLLLALVNLLLVLVP